MPYTSRSREEVYSSLKGAVYNPDGVSRFYPGDFADSLLYGVGEVVSAIDRRGESISKSFFFDAHGADLDERLRQLKGFPGRRGSSPASGPVLSATRSDYASSATFEPGAIVVASTGNGATYRNASYVTFEAGQRTYPSPGQAAINIVCNSYGPQGNADPGQITRVITGDGITVVTNVLPLSNGLAFEGDTELKYRAEQYIASYGGVLNSTLVALALSKVASDGRRAKFAYVIEDPRAGYVELVVDDGSAFAADSRPGLETSGVVSEGLDMFHFDSPAMDRQVQLRVNGSVVTNLEWTTISERGVAYLVDGHSAWTTGDTWSCTPKRVYTGFVAELQADIEGSSSDPVSRFGGRQSGIRVVVTTPTIRLIPFDAIVVAEDLHDIEVVEARVKNAILTFLTTVRPGRGGVLLMFDLLAYLHDVTGVLNVKLRNPSDTSRPAEDAYPVSRYSRFGSRLDLIKVNGR